MKTPLLTAAILCICLLFAQCGERGAGSARSAANGKSADGKSVAADGKSVQPHENRPPEPSTAVSDRSGPPGAGEAAARSASAPQPTRITVGPQGASPPFAGKSSPPGASPAPPDLRPATQSAAQASGAKAAASGGRSPRGPAFTGREDEYLMLSGLGGRIIPSDPRMGPLQDRYTHDSDLRSMYQLVDRFLSSLQKKRVETDALLPQDEPFISRRLHAAIDAGHLPDAWRIGRIDRPDDATAHLRLLLRGNPGVAVGDLFLVKYESKWYIGGVQVDFALLAVPPAAEKPVEPGSPVWMNNAQ